MTDRDSTAAHVEVDVEQLERSFNAAAHALVTEAARLPPNQSALLARLLAAARNHPFIGDAANHEAVAQATEHIADHVKPSKRRAREVADRIRDAVDPLRNSADDGTDNGDGRVLGAWLREILEQVRPLERHHLRELISNALGGLSPSAVVPSTGWEREAWTAAVVALSDAQTEIIPARPPFLNEELLAELVSEAMLQSFLSVRMAQRWVAPAGPAARRFGIEPALCQFASNRAGRVLQPGNGFADENATFLFYEDPGDAVQPHVDPFGITNALVMLDHQLPGGPPHANHAGSALLHFLPDGSTSRVAFEPGQLVVLPEGSIVHAREAMRPGERVTLLSLVFAPGKSAPAAYP